MYADDEMYVETVDLYVLAHVPRVRNDFYMAATLLQSVDLAPLANVCSVGVNFLAETKIVTLDLSPLRHLRSWPTGFLRACSRLTTLQCDPDTPLELIGDGVLANTTALQHIDTAIFRNVKSVGPCFLMSSPALQQVCDELGQVLQLSNFSTFLLSGNIEFSARGLTSLVQIDNFMGQSECSTIDTTGLTSLEHVGDHVFDWNKQLVYIKLDGLSNVIRIDDYFLAQCTALVRIDLTPLARVNTIGNSFLTGCTSLHELSLRPLANVKKIGHGFLAKTAIWQLDIAPLCGVVEIGNGFLYNTNVTVTTPREKLSKLLRRTLDVTAAFHANLTRP